MPCHPRKNRASNDGAQREDGEFTGWLNNEKEPWGPEEAAPSGIRRPLTVALNAWKKEITLFCYSGREGEELDYGH